MNIQLLTLQAQAFDSHKHTEAELQREVARLLDRIGVLWMHPANERKCTPRQGALLKRCGVKPGVPDVLIFTGCMTLDDVYGTVKHKGLAIELKSAKGRLSDEQRKWMDDLQQCGWSVHLCRTMESVVKVLNDHGMIGG